MLGPHMDDQKGKKAMVYKARKDRRKRGEKKGEEHERRRKGESHL